MLPCTAGRRSHDTSVRPFDVGVDLVTRVAMNRRVAIVKWMHAKPVERSTAQAAGRGGVGSVL